MKMTVIGLLAAGVWWQAGAGEIKWLTDVPEAQAEAQKEQKLVLMDFTGSDWCPWCIKLQKEIFNTPEFAAYAEKNLVTVIVDFPEHKAQSADLRKANLQLKAKYRVHGYPTMIVLDSAGKQIGELGYHAGGPKP